MSSGVDEGLKVGLEGCEVSCKGSISQHPMANQYLVVPVLEPTVETFSVLERRAWRAPVQPWSNRLLGESLLRDEC